MDSDNVTVIVGSTLETIARDPTKDVLLKVYAPWCPHCQALAPVYSRLATALQGVPSLVVAKVDKDENEHRDLDQVEVSGMAQLVVRHDMRASPRCVSTSHAVGLMPRLIANLGFPRSAGAPNAVVLPGWRDR